MNELIDLVVGGVTLELGMPAFPCKGHDHRFDGRYVHGRTAVSTCRPGKKTLSHRDPFR